MTLFLWQQLLTYKILKRLACLASKYIYYWLGLTVSESRTTHNDGLKAPIKLILIRVVIQYNVVMAMNFVLLPPYIANLWLVLLLFCTITMASF